MTLSYAKVTPRRGEFRHRSVRGFTLVELVITLVLVGILSAIAAPNFALMFEGNKMKGATEELYQLLQFARAEAIGKNRNIYVDVRASGTEWCVGYTDKTDCNCQLPSDATADNACTITLDGVDYTRQLQSTDYSGVSITNVTFSGNDYQISMPRGTVDASGTITFGSTNYTTGVVVSLMGRVRACSSASQLGYPSC